MKLRAGFTLVEALVAIAVVVLLAALLFPVLAAARKKAHEAACLSNLKQLGMALLLYRSNNDTRLPERLSHLFPEYVQNRPLFVCPLDPMKGRYEGTDRLEGARFLPSGVSYTWVPNWPNAIRWGWWDPWPDRGQGKWLDETPVSECHWQWATTFNSQREFDQTGAVSGNAFILSLDGSVRTWPGARPMEEWSPEG